MRTVLLGGTKAKGRVAVVDDEDYELVSRYSWHLIERRRPNGTWSGPYAATSEHANGTCRTLRMHTLITGWPETDHVNHNGLDNQRSNLRSSTRSQNCGNQRPTPGGTSQFKGVSWDSQAGRWKALIYLKGKRYYLGFHADERAAAHAYDAAAQDLFGEFACTNFPAAAATISLVAGTPAPAARPAGLPAAVRSP